jgi:beta-glucosidase
VVRRIALNPGEQRDVTVRVEPQMLSIFNPAKDQWEVVGGEYKIWAGGSSGNLPLSTTITLGGESKASSEGDAYR